MIEVIGTIATVIGTAIMSAPHMTPLVKKSLVLLKTAFEPRTLTDKQSSINSDTEDSSPVLVEVTFSKIHFDDVAQDFWSISLTIKYTNVNLSHNPHDTQSIAVFVKYINDDQLHFEFNKDKIGHRIDSPEDYIDPVDLLEAGSASTYHTEFFDEVFDFVQLIDTFSFNTDASGPDTFL